MKEEILKEFFIASFYAMCHLRGHGMPAAIFRKFWDLQQCKECTFRNFEQMDLIFVFFCSIIILNGLFNFTIHQHLTLEYTFRETYCIFLSRLLHPCNSCLGPHQPCYLYIMRAPISLCQPQHLSCPVTSTLVTPPYSRSSLWLGYQ